MVYLLCFHEKYKHAKHYIGFVARAKDLDKRMKRHRKGNGAKLIAAITKAGIGFEVARTWPNETRDFERKLKNRKNAKMLCPICSAKPSVMKPVVTVDIETGGLDTLNKVQPPQVFVKEVEDSCRPTKEYIPPHIEAVSQSIFDQLANDPATVIQRNEEFKKLEESSGTTNVEPKSDTSGSRWKSLWRRLARFFFIS